MRNQWKFLIQEGFRNLGADRTLSVSSVITLGICGVVLSFLLIGLSLMKAVDERYMRSAGPLRVFVAPGHEKPAQLRELEENLNALGAFDSVVFVDKAQALQEFRRDFGEEMTRALDVNPLPHSYRAYPKVDEAGAPLSGKALKALRDDLMKMPQVEEVAGNFTQLAWLDRWRAPLQTGSMILLAILITALALVVHNAIKLSLYARRNLVENMKYCGASGFFILAPFALEALLLGLLGGTLAAVALVGQVRLGALLIPTLPEWIPVARLCLYLIGGTMGIAVISSVSTVKAFLRGKLG
jgi:cell division transport system permease protein